MFGLVSRKRLIQCEREKIELRREIWSLQRQISDLKIREATDQTRFIHVDGKRLIAEAEVDRLRTELSKNEAERQQLLTALTELRTPPAAPAEEEKPQVRSLTGIEAVTRATNFRNRHHQGIA